MKIRFSAPVWGWGVEYFERYCLPSLLQPGNVPWLRLNGFDVTLTLFTAERDVGRLGEVVAGALRTSGEGAGGLDVGIATLGAAQGTFEPAAFKRAWFVAEARAAIAEDAAMMILAADLFYGNGSIRNAALCCRSRGTVVGGIYLRAREDAFRPLLERYRAGFGSAPISNARLVDAGLRSQIPALADSNVDDDRNASPYTGVATRHLGAGLVGMVHHLPTPVMFWPNASDVAFFDELGHGLFESLDHLWPAKLLAERRWRLLASSDLFFLLEITPEGVAERAHSYPAGGGNRYDDRYVFELPHTLTHGGVVAALRAEPFPA